MSEDLSRRNDGGLSAEMEQLAARIALAKNAKPATGPDPLADYHKRVEQVRLNIEAWNRSATETEAGRQVVALGKNFAARALEARIRQTSVKVRKGVDIKPKSGQPLGTEEKDIWEHTPGWIAKEKSRNKYKWGFEKDSDNSGSELKRELVSYGKNEIAVLTNGTIVLTNIPIFGEITPFMENSLESDLRYCRPILAQFLYDHGIKK